MFRGKKYQDAAKQIEKNTQYDAAEGFGLICKTASAKFDETVELHVKLGVDSRHADQQVRGAIVLPNGTGKSVRVLVFAKGDKADAAREAGADYVELHTGTYSNTAGAARAAELERLKQAAEFAHSAGLRVNAGHGIDYENIAGILTVPHLCELNIGHSIVGRAIMVGMVQAVREMVRLMQAYRG
mgnify:CR=1 FL=1